MGADPGKPGEFDGEEPTNVIDRPAESPQPEPEPENKDRAYFAPRVLPKTAMPREALEAEAPKIVLNLPEAKVPATSAEVAAARARRRAATVKIERGALGHDGLPRPGHPRPGALDPEPPEDDLAPEPTLLDIPIDVEAMGQPTAGPVGAAGPARPPPPKPAIAPVQPMSATPTITNLPRLQSPRGEPPALARPVSGGGNERSRAPWIVVGLVAIAALGVGAFVVIRPGAEAADEGRVPASTTTATSTAPTATPSPPATAPAATATETAPAAPIDSAVAAAPSGTATSAPEATATVGALPPAPTTTSTWKAPTPGPTSTWKPPAGTARPFGTGRKPTSDIPSGI